jgi:hypothetical protein
MAAGLGVEEVEMRGTRPVGILTQLNRSAVFEMDSYRLNVC